METKSVEIVPSEGGWAVRVGGITASVLPTYALAVEAANRADHKDDAPVIWVRDANGVTKPQKADTAARPAAVDAAPASEKDAGGDTSVKEHIAVPANIHGQDMRDLHTKEDDDT